MTPTDRLRVLLDKMGVEHYDHENGEPLRDLSEAGTDPATSWRMGGANVCAVPNKHGTFDLWIDNCTPEQAITATVGPTLDQDLQQALNFMRIWITDDAHLGESEISYELEKAEGLRNLEAIEQAIAATVGNIMTLDQATEYAERFMGDYAKVLLDESTLYVERDEPTDQHAFNVAERKEAQMARDLAEALATVGGYAITFAPTLDRPPETMVGETVYDSEGNAIGWIVNARTKEVDE